MPLRNLYGAFGSIRNICLKIVKLLEQFLSFSTQQYFSPVDRNGNSKSFCSCIAIILSRNVCVGGVSHEYLLIKCRVDAGTSSFIQSNAANASSVVAFLAAAAIAAFCSTVECLWLQRNSFESKIAKRKWRNVEREGGKRDSEHQKWKYYYSEERNAECGMRG